MGSVWSWLNQTPSELLKDGLFLSTVTANRFKYEPNTLVPMLVALLGIVTLVRLAQL